MTHQIERAIAVAEIIAESEETNRLKQYPP